MVLKTIRISINLTISGIAFLLGFGCSVYTKQDLIKNYEKNSKEILAAKEYVNSIIAPGDQINIEFQGTGTFYFHLFADSVYYTNWDIELNSEQVDTLLQKLGLTLETLNLLKGKLEDADCISIQSGEPCTIGYKRNGMGKYYYKVFNDVLSDSLIGEYNDGCMYIYFRDNIVLEYGGGAVGPQCFEVYE